MSSDGNLDIGPVFGAYSVKITFNSGSGTISVQGSHDGTNFVEFPEDGSYTSDAAFNISWGGYIRFNLSGSSSPDIDISLLEITY